MPTIFGKNIKQSENATMIQGDGRHLWLKPKKIAGSFKLLSNMLASVWSIYVDFKKRVVFSIPLISIQIVKNIDVNFHGLNKYITRATSLAKSFNHHILDWKILEHQYDNGFSFSHTFNDLYRFSSNNWAYSSYLDKSDGYKTH